MVDERTKSQNMMLQKNRGAADHVEGVPMADLEHGAEEGPQDSSPVRRALLVVIGLMLTAAVFIGIVFSCGAVMGHQNKHQTTTYNYDNHQREIENHNTSMPLMGSSSTGLYANNYDTPWNTIQQPAYNYHNYSTNTYYPGDGFYTNRNYNMEPPQHYDTVIKIIVFTVIGVAMLFLGYFLCAIGGEGLANHFKYGAELHGTDVLSFCCGSCLMCTWCCCLLEIFRRRIVQTDQIREEARRNGKQIIFLPTNSYGYGYYGTW